MKQITNLLFLISILLHFSCSPKEEVAVSQLSVTGTYITNAEGDSIQLKGMSLFWSNWAGEYYNYGAVKWLRDEWNCDIIRAPMGIIGNAEGWGYMEDSLTQRARIDSVIQAAIKLDLYIIVDWHSHDAHLQTEAAKLFFEDIARTYGNYPNIIYEIYNEPVRVSWDSIVKPYSMEVISVIREYDKNNIIICGTPLWAQDVDIAAENPITEFDNIAYSLHYYAATHKQYLRDKAEVAMNKGLALFVTEFGVCDASGGDPIDLESTNEWFDFLDKHKIGWCNWSVHHKKEAASALKPGVNPQGGWTENDLTESGEIIYGKLKEKAKE